VLTELWDPQLFHRWDWLAEAPVCDPHEISWALAATVPGCCGCQLAGSLLHISSFLSTSTPSAAASMWSSFFAAPSPRTLLVVGASPAEIARLATAVEPALRPGCLVVALLAAPGAASTAKHPQITQTQGIIQITYDPQDSPDALWQLLAPLAPVSGGSSQ
jgi:hypothetical protein